MVKRKGDAGPYEVGYGKPPIHTRWPKGVSGNPGGKKVKAESFADTFKRIAGEEIIVSKNGARIAITNVEAMLYAAFHKAQSGNPQLVKTLLKELAGSEETHGAAFDISEADIQVLETEADFRGLIEAVRAEFQSEDTSGTEEAGGPEDDDGAF